jgi:hypothetical protein
MYGPYYVPPVRKDVRWGTYEDKYIEGQVHTTFLVRFEVCRAVTMKNGDFSDVSMCGSCKNRRFRGIQRLHHQGDKNR